MTDDKDILQALYAACVQAWARFRKRWKGGKTRNTYIDCDAVECIEVYRN